MVYLHRDDIFWFLIWLYYYDSESESIQSFSLFVFVFVFFLRNLIALDLFYLHIQEDCSNIKSTYNYMLDEGILIILCWNHTVATCSALLCCSLMLHLHVWMRRCRIIAFTLLFSYSWCYSTVQYSTVLYCWKNGREGNAWLVHEGLERTGSHAAEVIVI